MPYPKPWGNLAPWDLMDPWGTSRWDDEEQWYVVGGAGPPSAQTINAPGITSTATQGTPSVSLRISPPSITSAATQGSPSVSLRIAPPGITSSTAVGTPTIVITQFVSPPGISSTTQVGSPTVQSGTIFLSPPGIPSSSTAGSPSVSLSIAPPGISSPANVGNPTLTTGLFIAPPSISSPATPGAPTLRYDQTLTVPGILDLMTIGTPTIVDSSVTREVLVQRRITEVFIHTSPSTLTLTPQERTTTAGGGRAWADLPSRDPQVLRIIEPSDSGARDPVRTSDGIERQVDYILLGSHNAEVGLYDRFQYKGDDCEVVALMHDNGYETRAFVVRRGPMST